MSGRLRALLAALFVCSCLALFVWWNVTKTRVLVLHSHDTEYPWTRGINDGLQRQLDRKAEYALRFHYMDARRRHWPEVMARSGLAGRLLVDRWRPQLVIAVDDDAQREVMKHYVNRPDIRIVFAGVNGDIRPYGYHAADNVTGILERAPWAAIRTALLSSELARGRRELRVLYLSDDSTTARNDADDMQKFQWAPIVLVGERTAATFEEWKTEIGRAQADADAILIGSYRQLATTKGERELVDVRDIVKWTEANSPLPLIGFKVAYAEDGGAVTIAASPYEQGETAAAMAIDILDTGKPPRDIPMVSGRQFVVSLHASGRSAALLGLPPIYESFARAINAYKP